MPLEEAAAQCKGSNQPGQCLTSPGCTGSSRTPRDALVCSVGISQRCRTKHYGCPLPLGFRTANRGRLAPGVEPLQGGLAEQQEAGPVPVGGAVAEVGHQPPVQLPALPASQAGLEELSHGYSRGAAHGRSPHGQLVQRQRLQLPDHLVPVQHLRSQPWLPCHSPST